MGWSWSVVCLMSCTYCRDQSSAECYKQIRAAMCLNMLDTLERTELDQAQNPAEHRGIINIHGVSSVWCIQFIPDLIIYVLKCCDLWCQQPEPAERVQSSPRSDAAQSKWGLCRASAPLQGSSHLHGSTGGGAVFTFASSFLWKKHWTWMFMWPCCGSAGRTLDSGTDVAPIPEPLQLEQTKRSDLWRILTQW